MASFLTSTSSKSSLLYLSFLGLILCGVFYLFWFKNPDVSKGLRQQAFRLNASAFANGIHLARMRYLTNNLKENRLNQWMDFDIGLDFSPSGYPIGTDIENLETEAPATVENCRQIWQFVLGPLQPKMYLTENKQGYWTQLNEDKSCSYFAFDLIKMQLSYHSSSGKVHLSE